MSRFAHITITALVIGLLGAVAPSNAEGPGLSGTVTEGGHTVSWNVGGVSAPPPALAGQYAGVVKPGAKVTLSGSMTYSLQKGYATNLRQSASLSGAPMQSFTGLVYGGTYPFSYNLTSVAPSGEGSGVVTEMYVVVKGINCNDSGVCGGPTVRLTIGVVANLDTEPPVITIEKPRGVTGIGEKTPVFGTLSDNSKKATMHAAMYSDGDVVMTGTKGPVRAVGQRWSAKWKYPKGHPGPFYECFWAEDAAGNQSKNAPFSACRWLSIQVPITRVSNGCGGSAWGEKAVEIMNWFGDVRFYGDQPVVMRGACNQHDAAYGGSTVVGMRTKKATDYRRWSRESVDDKFAADLTAQCDRFLKGRKLRKERRACYKEVPIYVGLVREFGQSVVDANSTVPGTQTEIPGRTTPKGGSRDNR